MEDRSEKQLADAHSRNKNDGAAAVQSIYEAKLKSAESALTFIQGEHKRVLAGLHEEIQKLQQKCSDLQFQVTSATGAMRAEDELRQHVQRLEESAQHQRSHAQELEVDLRAKEERLTDLEEQLSWSKLDFENQLESKEAKIQQLQKSLALQTDLGRLQIQCKKLYDEGEQECEAKILAVTRRARSPQQQSHSPRILQDDDGSWLARQPPQPSLKPGLNPTSSTRAKVFRHKLQQQQQKATPAMVASSASASASTLKGNSSACVERTDHDPQILLCSLDSLRQHRSSLPSDYRASVATLPPIGTGGANATATGPSSVTASANGNRASGRRRSLRRSDSLRKEAELEVLATTTAGVSTATAATTATNGTSEASK